MSITKMSHYAEICVSIRSLRFRHATEDRAIDDGNGTFLDSTGDKNIMYLTIGRKRRITIDIAGYYRTSRFMKGNKEEPELLPQFQGLWHWSLFHSRNQ